MSEASKVVDVRVYYGEVKWFNYVRNYGFIRSQDLESDVFAYKTSVLKFENKKVYLHKHDRVEFKLRRSEKGCEAYDVIKIPKIVSNFPSATTTEKAVPCAGARRNNFQAKCELTLLNVAKNLVGRQAKGVDSGDSGPSKKNTNLKVNRFDLDNSKISKEIKSLVKEVYLKRGVRVLALVIDSSESGLQTRILSINQKGLAHASNLNRKLPNKKIRLQAETA